MFQPVDGVCLSSIFLMRGKIKMSIYPVLLVHGINDSGRRFRKLQSYLLREGFGRVVAMDIIPPDASIPLEAMANQVMQKLFQLRWESGLDKIDLVGYSMGSQAVRFFIQRLGGKKWVRRFISISGPHRGTWAAYLRQNAGCRQMRPDSSFLKDLNGDSDPWGEVDVYSFYTPFDLMIFPGYFSRLRGARNRTFKVPLHPLMVSNEGVIRAVEQVLLE
jgi:triacylglycerol lipase